MSASSEPVPTQLAPSEEPTAASLAQTLENLKAACRKQPIPDAAIRKDRLDRLARALKDHGDALIDAIDRDFSCRSARETRVAELAAPLDNIRYLKRRIARWMRPQRRRVGLQMLATRVSVHYQPLGVVGIVAPWNYPVFLSVEPLAYAIAAGNRAMIKLSELAPESSLAIVAMIESVFSREEVVAVTGGVETAKTFVGLPFDHLLYTGSTAVGRQVMRAAADRLTPLTLELGGKSPAIIAPDADLARAAERICFGKTLNSGQTCLAPDFVYCHVNQLDEFAKSMRSQFRDMFPQVAGNPDYTAIINDRHHARLCTLIDDAKSRGARIEALDSGDPPGDGRRMPLQLITAVNNEMLIMQEEIFGPLLPILTYQDFDEVTQYLQGRPAPLALYLFDGDRHRIRNVIEQTRSGGVCLNDTLFHIAVHDAPFGGIGDSGFGAYHGREGFDRFSHARTVFSRPRFNTSRLIYPGASRFQRWLAKLIMR